MTATENNLNTLDAIEARSTALLTEMRTLVDTAGDADLEGDDATRYDDMAAELDRLATRKARLEVIARHASAGIPGDGAAVQPFQHKRTADPYDIADRRLVGPEVKGRALSAVEQTRNLDDAYKARATELLETIDDESGSLARHIVATGRNEYRIGFLKRCAGQEWAITEVERQAMLEARAASLTDSAGGYAVPFTLDTTLILTSDGSANPFRQIAGIRTTLTDTWNGVSTAGITAAFAAEATQASDNAPTIAQPSIQVHKAQAFVPFSIEIGSDWANIEADLRMAFADGKDTLEATKFALGAGNGSNEPVGIITALTGVSGSTTASATTDTYAVADVYATLEGLGPRYRSNASWIMSLPIINKTRQFGTALGHAFLTYLSAGQPPELLGRPLYEASALDSTITADANNYIAVCGDFSNYRIVDRVGMTVELVPHLFGADGRPTGQRGLYCYWRVGADSVNDAAFQMLNVT